MIYLSDFEKINENTWRVSNIHYMPFDEVNGLNKTKEELELEGILIQQLPIKQSIDNKFPILCCNPKTKEVFYQYEEMQTENSKNKEAILQETVLALMNKVAQLEKQVGGEK